MCKKKAKKGEIEGMPSWNSRHQSSSETNGGGKVDERVTEKRETKGMPGICGSS